MTHSKSASNSDGRSLTLEHIDPPEALLRGVFRASPESISIARLRDGAYIEVNERFEQLSGYRREEVIGRTAVELGIWQDMPGGREALVKELQARGSFRDLDVTLRNKAGEDRHCLISVELFRYDGEDCSVAVMRDITERRTAEEALRSHLKLEELITRISTELLSAAPSQLDETVNLSLEKLGEFVDADRCYVFRFRDDEQRMDNTHEWCRPGITPQIHRLQDLTTAAFSLYNTPSRRRDIVSVPRVRELSEKDRSMRDEFEAEGIKSVITVPMMLEDSVFGFLGFDFVREERTWPQSTVALLKIVGGMLAEAFVRREASEALSASEEKYRGLFEAASDGVILMEGDCIVDCNPAALAMFGVARDRLIGHTPYDDHLSPPLQPDGSSSRDQALRKVEDAAEGKPQFFEWQHRRVDGSLFDVETSLTKLEIGRESLILAIVRDVTERKRAKAEVEESERRIRTLIEQTTDAVFCYEYDPPIPTDLPVEDQVRRMYDAVLVECNDVCARSYGAESAQEVLGRKLTDLFGAPPPRLDGLFTEMIQGGYRTVDAEGVEVQDDGSKRYYLNNGHGVIENGKLLRVWGTFRDITERRLAEEELRETKALLSAAIEQTPAGVLIADAPDVRIRVANRAALDIRGDAKHRLMDIPVDLHPQRWQIHRPDGSEFPAEELPLSKAVLKGEVSTNVEALIRRPNGEDRWVLVNAAPVRDQDGEIRAGVVVFGDITENRQAREALRENEELLRQISDATPNSVFVKDRDGRYIMVNKALAERHGTTPEAMIGNRDLDYAVRWLKSDRDVEQFRASERQVIDNRQPLFIPEEQFTFRDGRTAWYQTTKVPLTVRGNPHCLLGVSVDVTDRKRAEEQLLQLNKRLEAQHEALLDKNVALREVLDHLEQEKRDYKHEICDSIEKLLNPIVSKLDEPDGKFGKREIATLRDRLNSILARDIDQFTSNMAKLSPRELDICDLIRQGCSSKEIADRLNISPQTVHKHRQVIRRKLQLSNKPVNLATYLRSR